MSEKRLYSYDKGNNKILCDLNDVCDFNVANVFRLLNSLANVNEQLREINKEIGDDLYNCRINKNIIREKLKLWQDVHKKYDIYNIKDFEESYSELEKTNKAMYNRLKEQSEIIYQLIQKLKEHITEKELKELMEDCGL